MNGKLAAAKRTLVETARRLLLAAGLALGLTMAGAATASPLTEFVETFDTTTYRDPATFAWWDTTLGEAKFFPVTTTPLGTVSAICSDVAVRGDWVYLVGGNGLVVVDASNPLSPTVAGSLGAFGGNFVDVAGDVAALGGSGGLRLVDVSDPTSPATYSTLNLGAINGVEIVGNLLYAVSSSTFFIFDISNPSLVSIKASVAIPGSYCQRVDVAGNHAYVAAGSGLAVIDIQNPVSPVVVHNGAEGTLTGVSAAGDLLYAADVDLPGLRVFDISDPANPSQVGSYTASFQTINLAVSGKWVYLATRDAGVTVVNVTDPSNPVLDEVVDTPGSVEATAVSGSRCFAADGATLRILDLGSGSPVAGDDFATSGAAQNVFVQGNVAYVCEGADGLTLVDITDVNNPILLGSVPLGDARNVYVDGDIAYVAGGSEGFVCVDVSDPAAPVPLGIALDGFLESVSDVWVEGDAAFAVYTSFTTRYWVTIDISDPTSPLPLAFQSGAINLAQDIVVDGTLALVATYSTLEAWDVTDINAPVLLGGLATPTLNALDMSGDIACAVSAGNLIVYDIGNPGAISQIGSALLSAGGTGLDIRIDGDFAYVAADSIGLYAFDISNPASPTLPWYAFDRSPGLFVDGELIYRARGTAGLGVISGHNRDFDGYGVGILSTTVPSGPDTVRAIRMTLTCSNPSAGFVTGDGGLDWEYVPAGPPVWTPLPTPGTNVRWQTALYRQAPLVNTVLSQVRLEYLYSAPVITEVSDIPGDQGRQVRLGWTRSFHDDSTDPMPVLEYAIYRKIEPLTAAQTLEEGAEQIGALGVPSASGVTGIRAVPDPGSERETASVGDGSWDASALSGWDYVASVPADVDDAYSMVVPTLADSTEGSGVVYSTFLVRARTGTPGVYHESAPDSGYSVDNLAPNAPQNLMAAYATGSGNTLSWDASGDPDFRYFVVYRGDTPDFAADTGSRAGTTTGTAWTDDVYDTGGVYYKVTAVDFSGNESTPSSPGQVVGIGGEILPLEVRLSPGAPNPFRSRTVIRYRLPVGGRDVSLRVFDAAGRLVRTLDRGFRPGGTHEAVWDGRNDGGRLVRSGRYFYRLRAGDEVRSGSVIRLR